MATWTFRDLNGALDITVDDTTTNIQPYLASGRYAVKTQPPATVLAPSAVAGTNNGTTPPAPVITAGAKDSRGNITFGSGTTPAIGNQVVVTFSAPQPSYGAIDVQAKNALTQGLGIYVVSASTTGFTLASAVAPAASQANTVYSFDWQWLT